MATKQMILNANAIKEIIAKENTSNEISDKRL